MFRTLRPDARHTASTPHSSPGLHFPPLVVLYFSYERFAPLLRCGPPHCSVMLRNNGLIKVRPCRVKWFRCVHTSIHSGLAPSLRQSVQNLYSELEIFREITTNKVLVSQASQYILQLVRLLEWYWSWWWFCLVLRHLNSLLTSHGLISISVTSAQPAIFREISVRSSTDAQWRMDSLPLYLPPRSSNWIWKQIRFFTLSKLVPYWWYNKRLTGQLLILSRRAI